MKNNVIFEHEGVRLEMQVEQAKTFTKETFTDAYKDLFKDSESAFKAFQKAFEKTDVKK